MRQLGLLRESFGISEDPASKRSTSPLARKPKRDPEASPPPNRLARAPGFAEIQEEDEEDAGNASPTPSSRPSSLRLKPRRSSSRLSLPQFASTPSPTEEEAPVPEKRKPARRQSALLGSAVAPSSTTTTAPVTTSIHPSVTTRRPRNSVAVRDVVSDVVTDNEVPSPTAEEDEVVEVKPKPARLSKERKREPEMRFEVFGDPVEELTGPPKRGAKSVSRETRAKEGFEFEDPPPSTRKLVDVTNSPRRKLASLDTKRKSGTVVFVLLSCARSTHLIMQTRIVFSPQTATMRPLVYHLRRLYWVWKIPISLRRARARALLQANKRTKEQKRTVASGGYARVLIMQSQSSTRTSYAMI
jgi:hypothetical protein